MDTSLVAKHAKATQAAKVAQAHARNFAAIRDFLTGYPGGEVVLSRAHFNKGIAVIYLDNMPKRNAITGTMMIQLRDIIMQLEEWKEGKAVIIAGVGRHFCSGGDLEFARATGSPGPALFIADWMQDTLQRLKNLPLISVCLVQGYTLGGGAEISVYCDYIIGASDLKYGFVHGTMAITTAWGGGTRLSQKVGEKNALNILLKGQVMTAWGCLHLKIIDHVVDAKTCLQETFEWLQGFLTHHPSIIQSFKLIVTKACNDNEQNSLRLEKNLFSHTWGSELNRQALDRHIHHGRSAEPPGGGGPKIN